MAECGAEWAVLTVGEGVRRRGRSSAEQPGGGDKQDRRGRGHCNASCVHHGLCGAVLLRTMHATLN